MEIAPSKRNGGYFSQRWVVQVAFVFLIGISSLVFTGCSEDPARGPGPVIVFDENAFAAEISEAKSLIDLARIKRDFETTGEDSPAISRALEEKWNFLLAETEPIGPICEEADLIEVEYRLTGPSSWGLDYLFRVNQPFPEDYYIFLQAYVQPEDRDRLTTSAYHEGGYENWGFAPIPPISRWKAGEYQLIHRTLEAAQPISYRFVTGLYKPGAARYGEEIDLGWWAPQPVSADFLLEAINATDNIFELLKIKRQHSKSSAWSTSVASAFIDSWTRLSKEAKPNKPFSDRVDLVAFDFQRIGEENYLLTYLFDVRERMENDYRIYVHGYVDSGHLHYLPEERREYKFANWSFAPQPPTSAWSPGDKVLVTAEITAAPIPYDLRTGFYLPGMPGGESRLDLGWQADPGR